MRWMLHFFGSTATALSAHTPSQNQARVQNPDKKLPTLLDAPRARPPVTLGAIATVHPTMPAHTL